MKVKKKLILLLKIPYKIWSFHLIPALERLIGYPSFEIQSSEIQNIFGNKLSRYKINKNGTNQSVVLCQMVEDYAMCIKLAAASSALAKRTNSYIALYTASSKLEDRRFWGDSFIKQFFTERLYNQLDNIYLAFSEKILTRNIYSFKDKEKVNKIYFDIKSNIRTKDDVLNISIDGIKIGDLIYDTYLRFRHKPTIDLNDKYLDKVIIEAINLFLIGQDIILRIPIKALVNSYTTYIHHGILVRICLKNGIQVYTVGGHFALLHKVLPEYPSHANNHFLFHEIFGKLNRHEELLSMVKKKFESRFEGVIDTATSYMKQSAFSSLVNKEMNSVNWNKTVVVFAHCFFDSPHIYRDLLFPDFYEWITFTLDILSQNSDLNILVKSHPNGIEGNDEIFEFLKKKYFGTNINFIDKNISQLQIVNAKPKAIVTAYGTVAAEFAYKGIPVLTVYDNPFTAFDFTYMSNSKKEYENYLRNIHELKPKQNQAEIIEYYYMQYHFFLQGREADYLDFSKYKGQIFSDDFLIDYLPKMTETYFKTLDAAIKEGLDITDWEEKQMEITKMKSKTSDRLLRPERTKL